MPNMTLEHYDHIESELKRIKGEMDVLFDIAWGNESYRLGRDIATIQQSIQGLIYMTHPQPEWTGGDSSDPNNFTRRMPHIHTLA